MSFRSELETLAGALRFFTRLPLPGTLGHSGVALHKSIRYFPLAGVIVGAIGAAVFSFCMLFWPKTLAVLAAIATIIYLTGAIHEDGWSDMVDGFGGGWDKQRILDIMKDSRVGSFGVVALVMMLLVRFMALVEIDIVRIPAALVAAHAFSRLCSTLILATMEYVRDQGKAKPFDNHLGIGGVGTGGENDSQLAAVGRNVDGADGGAEVVRGRHRTGHRIDDLDLRSARHGKIGGAGQELDIGRRAGEYGIDRSCHWCSPRRCCQTGCAS